MTEKEFEICILGAGPSGSAAALQLAKAGIRCALIDRSVFPREKICGDGISGRSIASLKEIDPGIIEELKGSPAACPSWGVKFVAPNNNSVDISFRDFEKKEPPGYVIRRREFDQMLLKRTQNSGLIEFFEGTPISSIEKGSGWQKLVSEEKQFTFKCKLLLLATGDNSTGFIKQLDPSFADGPVRPGIGIRSYFKGVDGIDEDNKIEIHFYRQILPWYFWIFPLNDGIANVGMGMLHDSVAGSDKSMKKIFHDLIENEPELKTRFRNAEPVEEIKAARLFYYSSKKSLAGDGYMLLGDAAELVDPFTGEGIGNALSSGIIAAKVAGECINSGDFSVSSTKLYEDEVYGKLLRELEMGLRIQNRASSAQLINLVINKARKSRTVRKTLMKMIYNINNMGELANPLFYLKLVLNL